MVEALALEEAAEGVSEVELVWEVEWEEQVLVGGLVPVVGSVWGWNT